MKKTYEMPEVGVMELEMVQFLASSGFDEGDTETGGTGSGTGDPSEAL